MLKEKILSPATLRVCATLTLLVSVSLLQADQSQFDAAYTAWQTAIAEHTKYEEWENEPEHQGQNLTPPPFIKSISATDVSNAWQNLATQLSSTNPASAAQTWLSNRISADEAEMKNWIYASQPEHTQELSQLRKLAMEIGLNQLTTNLAQSLQPSTLTWGDAQVSSDPLSASVTGTIGDSTATTAPTVTVQMGVNQNSIPSSDQQTTLTATTNLASTLANFSFVYDQNAQIVLATAPDNSATVTFSNVWTYPPAAGSGTTSAGTPQAGTGLLLGSDTTTSLMVYLVQPTLQQPAQPAATPQPQAQPTTTSPSTPAASTADSTGTSQDTAATGADTQATNGPASLGTN